MLYVIKIQAEIRRGTHMSISSGDIMAELRVGCEMNVPCHSISKDG